MKLQAKTAIVTGSSSGIGLATAQLLARNQYSVFGFSRSEGNLPDIKALRVDVRDPQSIAAAIEQVVALTGQIDVVVNAAGYAILGAIEESSLAQAQALFDTNVLGVFRVCQAVLPYMRTQQAGRILNIGSIVGLIPAPFMGFYASSKHALEGYTESLGHEMRTFGVRAILIEPEFTRTQIAHNTQHADSPLADYRLQAERLEKYISQAVEQGIDPEAVARVILSAIAAPAPRLRYAVGKQARLLSQLRRLVPPALFDRSLRKQFNLDAV